MLSKNIKASRQAKGFSQEELAKRVHVVRQTISKWEQGLSVPDAHLLIALADALETSVSTLLGATTAEKETPAHDLDVTVLAEKLALINLQLAQKSETRRKILRGLLLALCGLIVLTFVLIIKFKSPYLTWDYSNPETAVVGVGLHALEWLFVRLAPFVLLGALVGIFLMRKKG